MYFFPSVIALAGGDENFTINDVVCENTASSETSTEALLMSHSFLLMFL